MEANKLLNDQIYQKKELLIPVVDGMKLNMRAMTPAEAEAKKIKQEMYLKEVNRSESLRMLVRDIADSQRSIERIKFKEEARMYLEDCGYDYDKAKAKWQADLKWEEEQKRLAKANKPGFFAKLFSSNKDKQQ